MVEFENVYLDSSVILRLVLRQPNALQARWSSAVSSELLSAEVFRNIDNLRVEGLPAEETARFRAEANHNLSGVGLMPLSARVLRRVAGNLPTPIRTLDAIHLSTALLWNEDTGEAITLLTHDRQLAIAAQANGLQVYPRLIR